MKLEPYPKLFVVATCRGGSIPNTVHKKRGEETELEDMVHQDADMFTIYGSMPGEPITDSKGNGKGSHLVEALDEFLRNDDYRLKSLNKIYLKVTSEIGEGTNGRELADVHHTHSKPIYLRRKSDALDLLLPPEIRVLVLFFFTCPLHHPNKLKPLSALMLEKHRLPERGTLIEL